MKISKLLKSVRLYGAARWGADRFLSAGEFLKRWVYRSVCRRELREREVLEERPAVLVVMCAGGIGNVIEATPLVQALRIRWPKCRLTILTPYEDMFGEWCIVDEVCSDRAELAGRRFDYTFVPFWGWHGFPENEVGDGFERGEVFVSRPALGKWFLRNERDYNVDLARRLGYRGPAPWSYVNVRKPAVADELAEPWLCVLPGGKTDDRWRWKRWPNYAELIGVVRKEWQGCRVCVVGTEDDEVDERVFEDEMVVDLRGKLSLAESAWVLKHSAGVVGNDCGPMHMADAVGARAVAIFGPTCVVKNGGRGKNVVITAGEGCQPCQYGEELTECEAGECMRELGAERVFAMVRDVLGRYLQG
ncbi:ADP-heptose:LPS heptosyl transferase I [Anaerohalosphaera lusitana]|uniref:ADP-heptose:LPS heptosyl transferase I n=1 Tax=Anaerohalosphaera lusitana TaxID=1936003 RepID=A0A1U9NPC9_9BACT|nr:glycosyltransferase family 9 protein [Anaerohalosphaera lusitana]AQT69657.1 ADP-heptose:LPS heptosyl transferase I [Anaerohalosphaera lusitana]